MNIDWAEFFFRSVAIAIGVAGWLLYLLLALAGWHAGVDAARAQGLGELGVVVSVFAGVIANLPPVLLSSYVMLSLNSVKYNAIGVVFVVLYIPLHYYFMALTGHIPFYDQYWYGIFLIELIIVATVVLSFRRFVKAEEKREGVVIENWIWSGIALPIVAILFLLLKLTVF